MDKPFFDLSANNGTNAKTLIPVQNAHLIFVNAFPRLLKSRAAVWRFDLFHPVEKTLEVFKPSTLLGGRRAFISIALLHTTMKNNTVAKLLETKRN